MADVRRLKQYAIDSAVLRRMKPDAVILHPLPRTVELDKTVDNDPRALYFPASSKRPVRPHATLNLAVREGLILHSLRTRNGERRTKVLSLEPKGWSLGA